MDLEHILDAVSGGLHDLMEAGFSLEHFSFDQLADLMADAGIDPAHQDADEQARGPHFRESEIHHKLSFLPHRHHFMPRRKKTVVLLPSWLTSQPLAMFGTTVCAVSVLTYEGAQVPHASAMTAVIASIRENR